MGQRIFIHEYVTGGGLAGSELPASWAVEGGAMRRALVEDFAGLPGALVVMTLDARLPEEPGPWTTVRVGPDEEPATFARLAGEADRTALIAPESGGVLRERAALIEEAGGRSLGATPAAIGLAADKRRLGDHLTSRGVPTPPTRLLDPGYGLPQAFSYPAVLKPVDGAGAVDTFLIKSAEARLPAEALRMGAALLQPFLPGTPLSASVLVDGRGRPHLLGFARQRIALAQGRFSYGGGTLPVEAEGLRGLVLRAVASVPGLKGWVGVDLIRDDRDGRATVLEINPRLTTSYLGFRKLSPAGMLAAAWLSAIDRDATEEVEELSDFIDKASSLTFDADGTVPVRAVLDSGPFPARHSKHRRPHPGGEGQEFPLPLPSPFPPGEGQGEGASPDTDPGNDLRRVRGADRSHGGPHSGPPEEKKPDPYDSPPPSIASSPLPTGVGQRQDRPGTRSESETVRMTDWLALDVGGANLKAAHANGDARTAPFELWKRPGDLAGALSDLVAGLPRADRVAVTMTAELCDCFETKADGVRSVLSAVRDVFGERPVRVWGTDGKFHDVPEILGAPALAAASNWLALATVAARMVPEGPGLLIDVGSTTTDLIVFRDGVPAPRGRTDTERLRTGELVYAGLRRTPVCALATELPWRGSPTGLAAELFATTLDVYLTLGDLSPDPTNCSTADGRPATVEAARDRLARMVGADRGTFSSGDALDFARAADAALLGRLEAAALRVVSATVGRPRVVVVSGSGVVLARRLADRLIAPDGAILDLDRAWGPVASAAGCAHALLILAHEGEHAGALPGP